MLSHSGRKRSSLGSALYIVAALQFVVLLAIAGSRYGPPTYNPVTVTISDLQAVDCGTFQGAQVCSPLHALANLSVAALGALVVAGSLLLRPAFPGGRRRDAAVGLLVVAGLASVVNAFTPEDVTWIGDLVTALVAFLGANFGLVQIGRAMPTGVRWGGLRFFSQCLGILGVGALTLDGFGLGTVIGTGTVEWLIVAPILIWTPTTGIYLILETRSAQRKGVLPSSK